MKTLHLNLKREWFDMILSGGKKEEYRDINKETNYWFRRFKNPQCRCMFRLSLSIAYERYKEKCLLEPFKGLFDSMELKYKSITFSNGYAKNRDQFVVELKYIKFKKGKPEWGAEKDKFYFALGLGEINQDQIK